MFCICKTFIYKPAFTTFKGVINMKAGKLTILILIGLMFALIGVVSAAAYYPGGYQYYNAYRFQRPYTYGIRYPYNHYYRAPYYHHYYTPYYMMTGWGHKPYYYANYYYRGYRGYPTYTYTYYRPGGWWDPYGGW